MAYQPSQTFQGLLSFTNVDASGSTVAPPGTIVQGVDPTSGMGEFIYLRGGTSIAVGSVCTFNQHSTSGSSQVPNTANQSRTVAVSMAANTATTSFSWFQISGIATVLKTAVRVTPGSQLWISGTAGRVMGTAASGKQLVGAICVNAATVLSATSTIIAQINRPFAQGQTI